MIVSTEGRMSRMFDGRIRTYTFTLAGGETFRVFGSVYWQLCRMRLLGDT
jgi:hypothetical protein